MRLVQSAVYLLCSLTSFVAMLLVYRSYLQSRTRLLLWTALAFVALAVDNLVLSVDIVMLPEISLLMLRHLVSLLAVGLLLYGFVWELD